MGYCPDWYSLIRNAKFLGVAPWELLEQPVFWRDWAEQAQSAEYEAKHQKDLADARKNK